jgi:hypothetical protein
MCKIVLGWMPAERSAWGKALGKTIMLYKKSTTFTVML